MGFFCLKEQNRITSKNTLASTVLNMETMRTFIDTLPLVKDTGSYTGSTILETSTSAA